MSSDIPSEIICLIAEALDSQQDRFHLAVSCRRLYRLLLPALYSHVGLCGIRAISSFLYTIVGNEELATAVRFLGLHGWAVPGDDWASAEEFEYDAKLMHKLALEVGCFGVERDEWIRNLELGVDDAWLALLIPRLTGLRRMYIMWPYGTSYFADMFAKVAFEDVPVFPHLEESYAAWYDTEGGADTSLMLPFFKFPAMRKIGGYTLRDDPNDKPAMTRLSTVTEIDLLNSNSFCGLRNWIGSCQPLRRFRITYDDPLVSPGEPFSFGELDIRAIQQSLQLHKTMLESVWICLNNDENLYEGEVGSFAEFTTLKTLHISVSPLGLMVSDYESLVSRQLKYRLPPSLENLFLCDCSPLYISQTCKQLEDLINLGVVPNLMRLGLQSKRIHHAPRRQQDLEQLKHRCKEAGIVFNVYSKDCAIIGGEAGFDWPFPEFTIGW
ncbi:hypothetical protein PHISP_05225 [Aspergillus sp. HF37]|nr:hypothetical protein PHISP_05225 [Aspergillus sp. HF37]